MAIVRTHPFPVSTTRRRLLGTAVGAATLAALPAGRTIAAATPTAGSGEWTFTDDKGVQVTLPERPVRIVSDVNAAAPLWDFGIRPLGVFGWNASETGDFGPAGGNVDPDRVAVVGNPTETIQLEEVLTLDPDLIVTLTWTPEDPTEYWSIDPEVVDRVKEIAPLVAISATGRADANTERFAELAGLLGADLTTPELAEAKTKYESALQGFPTTAAAKSDLTSLFIYLDASAAIFVANPIDWADLTLYQELGLNITLPETAPGTFWEEVSIEEAIKYPADIVFHSTRPGTLTAEELMAHPIMSQHPAIKAGQLGTWNQDFIMSYQGMTIALESTISVLANATKVT